MTSPGPPSSTPASPVPAGFRTAGEEWVVVAGAETHRLVSRRPFVEPRGAGRLVSAALHGRRWWRRRGSRRPSVDGPAGGERRPTRRARARPSPAPGLPRPECSVEARRRAGCVRPERGGVGVGGWLPHRASRGYV